MAITIKNNYLALTFGEVYESLDAVGSSDVTWHTSNPSIVSLSNSQSYYNHSLITLTAGSTAGTAIITAVSNADNTIYDTCEVHVMQSVVHVNGVRLDSVNVYLRVNETHQFIATVTPSTATNKHVVWSVPIGGIIRVDENGLVTAMREGTSSVIATTMDGGYMRTCSVVVSNSSPVLVNDITISPSSINLTVGKTAKATATVSPSNATNKNINWSVGESSVISVNQNGIVTALRAGSSRLYANSADGNAQSWITVNVSESGDGPTPGPEPGPGPYPDSDVFFDTLGADEVINDITSVGNTLIVSTSKDMYYFLWRDGSYRFLGNQIPIPDLSFMEGGLSAIRSVPEFEETEELVLGENKITRLDDDMTIFPHENIGDVTNYGSPARKYVFDIDYQKGFWNEFLDLTWGEIDKQVAEHSRSGKAVFPVFARYAVRLYDGTHYAQSIPILLGADIGKFIDAKAVIAQIVSVFSDGPEKNSKTEAGVFVKLSNPYSIVMNAFSRNLFDGWEDIVTAVDIFVSPQLKPVQRNAARFDMEYVGKESAGGGGPVSAMLYSYKVENFVIDPYYTEENQEKLMLNYQNTYLARSFTIDEFKALPEDYVLDIDTSSDYIMAQEALKETSQSMHHTVGARMFNYNKSLLLAGAKQSLYNGYPFLHSVKWDDMEQNPVRFVYYIRGENGEAKVVCRDVDGNKQITPMSAAVLENLPILYHEAPVAWLAYPDSRCYRIDVYFVLPGGQVRYKSYPTKAMDQTDVAYAFVGFGVDITATESATLPETENGTIEMPNSLVVSKVNNPFVFPATDIVTFTAGEIFNLAVANVPLSEGQAGQFPLYVFTDEGVFAMTVDAEGKLRTSHNVSRDILLSPDAVVGIEQGVFFAAARGLLLLQGSRVTKVSSEMEGTPDLLSEELLGRINNQFLGFSPDNPRELRSFLSGCFLAYDYANTRIIVANPAYSAMYVYKFDTQSWHRLQTPYGKPIRALNSFPEAQLAMQGGSRQSLLDFSVLAESPDAETLRGIVYTRDLDLDGADIYKTISRLKVRGRFSDGHVKWQLQGSNDGLDYKTIHSLRGPSWKWYRLVLVTMLDKNERVSYVELDYSPKFTDKIR